MEIERRYLVEKIPENINEYRFVTIEQAYICTNPTLRIRKKDEEYILTYKSKVGLEAFSKGNNGVVREEVEFPLSKEAYDHLLEKHDYNVIYKRRYLIPLGDEKHTIEFDVFEGRLEGLLIAEVEFESIEEASNFKAPSWFGREISNEKGYSNADLARK